MCDIYHGARKCDAMTPEEEATIDWSVCTWEGSRRAQQKSFSALPLREKLEIVEEMADLVRRFEEERKRQGLPYTSIEAGERVPGSPTERDSSVAPDP
jgi:hypothetical protein